MSSFYHIVYKRSLVAAGPYHQQTSHIKLFDVTDLQYDCEILYDVYTATNSIALTVLHKSSESWMGMKMLLPQFLYRLGMKGLKYESFEGRRTVKKSVYLISV